MDQEFSPDALGILPLSMDYFDNPQDIIINNSDENPLATIWLLLPSNGSKKTLSGKTILVGEPAELVIVTSDELVINGSNFSGFHRVVITDHLVTTDNQAKFPEIRESQNSALVTINEVNASELWLWGTNFLINPGIISNLLKIVGKTTKNIELLGSRDQLLQIGNIETEASDATFLAKYTNFIGSQAIGQLNTFTGRNLSFGEEFQAWNLKAKVIDIINISETESTGLKVTGIKKFNFDSDVVILRSLNCAHGEYYIAPGVSVKFKPKVPEMDDCYSGLSLILNLQDSEADFTFPPCKKLVFDKITISSKGKINFYASEVISRLIEVSGTSLLRLNKVTAENFVYQGNGDLTLKQIQAKNFLYQGKGIVHIGGHQGQISAYNIDYAEIKSGGHLFLHGEGNIGQLRMNLDVNAESMIKYAALSSEEGRGLTIYTTLSAKINSILGKVSRINMNGNVEVNEAFFQIFREDDFIFMASAPVKFMKLVLGGIEIIEDEEGIRIKPLDIRVRATNSGASAIIAAVNINSEFLLAATSTNMLSVWGKYTTGSSGDIIFRSLSDLNINKTSVTAGRYLITDSLEGEVRTYDSELRGQSIVQAAAGAGGGVYVASTNINAEQYLVTSINGDTILTEVASKTKNMVVLSEAGKVELEKVKIISEALSIGAKKSATLIDSNLITLSFLVKALEEAVLIKTSIEISKIPYVVFTDVAKDGNAKPVSLDSNNILLGMLSPNIGKGLTTDLTSLTYNKINSALLSNEEINAIYAAHGNVYFDVAKASIIGSRLTGAEKVIIKCKESIEILPLVVYNRIMANGGFVAIGAESVMSEITSGLIDIEAKDSITIIKSVLKATYGKVDADVINVINPDKISNNQKRWDVLKKWGNNSSNFFNEGFISGEDASEAFQFSDTTEVKCHLGLDIYNLLNLNSKNLIYSKIKGDVIFDKSAKITYDKLVLNVEQGKVLFVSPNIYGSQLAHAAEKRTVIGGENLYIEADIVEMKGSKVLIKGDLKIVTKDGVHILPVAVHNRLVHYNGSKATIDESSVRQVISEINAGYLDIDAGKELEIISALIKATNVDIKAEELNILSARERIERHVYFQGGRKWHGGRSSWEDHSADSNVVPTQIEVKGRLLAEINGNTTIQSAAILTEADSIIKTKGNLTLLSSFDIHVHDHKSKKSSLFKWGKGGPAFFTTKTAKEHFYNEDVTPTIYYSGGNFYGESDGRIHILGSKIIGNDIHLLAPKGVKLEAVRSNAEKMVFIKENGIRSGFRSGGGEHASYSEIFSDVEKTNLQQKTVESAELLASNKLEIVVKDADFEMISSKLGFKKAYVKAKGMKLSTIDDQFARESKHIHVSAGLYSGVQEPFSDIYHKVDTLAKKRGDHALDIMDRALKLYSTYKAVTALENRSLLSDSKQVDSSGKETSKPSMVGVGAWIGAGVSFSSMAEIARSSRDNEIVGGKLTLDIDGDIKINGIKCEVGDIDVKAESMSVTTGNTSTEQESFSYNLEVKVPIVAIVGTIKGGAEAETKALSKESITHHHNYIRAHGKMVININKHTDIIGVEFTADNLEFTSGSMSIKSEQDTYAKHFSKMRAGFSVNGNDGNAIPSAYAEKGIIKENITNQIAGLIGNMVRVEVKDTLEMVGSIINSSSGDLVVKAGRIEHSSLADYHKEDVFGLGAGNDNLRVRYGDKGSSGVVRSVIGAGKLEAGSVVSNDGEGSALLRDPSKQITRGSLKGGELDAEIPVKDIWYYVKAKVEENKAKEKLASDEKLIYTLRAAGLDAEQAGLLEEYLKLPECEDKEEEAELRKILSVINNELDKEFSRRGLSLSSSDRAKAAAVIYNLSEKAAVNSGALGLGLGSPAAIAAGGPAAAILVAEEMGTILATLAGGYIISAAIKFAIENNPEGIFNLDEKIDGASNGAFEKSKHKGDKASSAAANSGKVKLSAASGMPDPDDFEPDDEGEKERKEGVPKGESPVWKELKSYRDSIKTNGLKGNKQRFYEWDYLHNEIEVYDSNGRHLGAMDPLGGRMFKSAEAGRTINLK